MSVLAASLDNAGAEDLPILNELHCVICHDPYHESENNSVACKIPHSNPEGVVKDQYDALWHGFDCCGEDFDENSEFCIRDRHTV